MRSRPLNPLAVLAVALLVCACQHRTAQPPPSITAGFPPDFPTAFYSGVPADALYRVDAARSALTIKVYRAGALAKLGHNHVITSNRTDGFVYLADDLTKARGDLFVPVDSFVVDDAAARAAAGAEFSTQPTPGDIGSTRANMLGPKLLDASHYPFVVVHVEPLQVGTQSTRVALTIRVRDHVASVPVDVLWQRVGNELTIGARFRVDHSALGLEPFSALGGALKVDEPIDVELELTATQTRATWQ